MKVIIRKIAKRQFPGSLSMYPYDVTVMVEDGRELTVHSWNPESSVFLFHVRQEIEKIVSPRKKSETRQQLIASIVGKTYNI